MGGWKYTGGFTSDGEKLCLVVTYLFTRLSQEVAPVFSWVAARYLSNEESLARQELETDFGKILQLSKDGAKAALQKKYGSCP
jgi:hypothetical protein